MEGLMLLCGHLVGDFILQNDWMASNKTNPRPGPDPLIKRLPDGSLVHSQEDADIRAHYEWWQAGKKWRLGHLACTVHCLLYTLAVWAFTFAWMPWWGLVACFACHWPIDRFRLAGRWMRNVSCQKVFASMPPVGMAPWSVIVVDNTIHIVTLAIIGKIAGVS